MSSLIFFYAASTVKDTFKKSLARSVPCVATIQLCDYDVKMFSGQFCFHNWIMFWLVTETPPWSIYYPFPMLRMAIELAFGASSSLAPFFLEPWQDAIWAEHFVSQQFAWKREERWREWRASQFCLAWLAYSVKDSTKRDLGRPTLKSHKLLDRITRREVAFWSHTHLVITRMIQRLDFRLHACAK